MGKSSANTILILINTMEAMIGISSEGVKTCTPIATRSDTSSK